ncbi:hypothetical protein BDA99DRAFT_610108 [Phascolomyces articulosus]|uniref:Ornithine decarboxylase n=1 Tax=Phascolomyces articulosus TaxID=60185 RepID=A0AAD5JWV0_9FUNG|nr:hypothetical protein BDA99DRAFT_610108 [Phascolomyces articulosus]
MHFKSLLNNLNLVLGKDGAQEQNDNASRQRNTLRNDDKSTRIKQMNNYTINTVSPTRINNGSNRLTTKVMGNSVEEAIKEHFEKTVSFSNNNIPVECHAFYVGDLGELHRQYLKWKALLPRIQPFYAIKCNPDSVTIQYLASLGMGFDCASKMEIQQVLELGVDPDQIIYAQPVKQPSFLRYASQNNVSLMTFDNEDELYKIKEIYPNAKLVLRICFHVGCECSNADAFYHALVRARHVFGRAETFGYQLTLLDVGGGFNDSSVVEGTTFEKVAAVLGSTVDELFPSKDVRVIAEPGRYFVGGPAYVYCVGIIGRRTVHDGDKNKKNSLYVSEKMQQEDRTFTYYINDGYYGSPHTPTIDEYLKLNPRVLRKNGICFYGREIEDDEKNYPCTIWGPACCSYDRIDYDGNLPELHIGDRLYFENFGAYTIAAASNFNGCEKAKIIHVNSYHDS